MTSAYPFYFAVAATENLKTERVAVFEIDVPDDMLARLYPDEDFIAQIQTVRPGESLLKNTEKVELDLYQQSWKLSLEHLGNVSHKGSISPRHISRLVLIDAAERGDLLMNFGDPTISLLNFRIMRGYYEAFVSWLFGDRRTLPGMLGMDLEQMDEQGGHFRERANFIREMSRDRHGIEVREFDK